MGRDLDGGTAVGGDPVLGDPVLGGETGFGEDAVLAVVQKTLADLLDLDPESLAPDGAVVLLDIDSLTAAELIVHTQVELAATIDFQELARDWSDFTLRDLAAELARCARPKAHAGAVRGGGADGGVG